MGPPESETPSSGPTEPGVEEEIAGQAKSGGENSSDPGSTPASNVVALPVPQWMHPKTKLEIHIELMSTTIWPKSPEATLYSAMSGLKSACAHDAGVRVTVDRDALRMVLGHLDWCHERLGLFPEGSGLI